MAKVVDRSADRAAYKQLADILRSRIQSGELLPGAQLPSEPRLGDIHDLGRESVRKALTILRAEGLITTVSGKGTTVRQPPPREVITVGLDALVWARTPTSPERDRLGLADGVPVLVVEQGATEQVYAGDRIIIRFAS